MTTLNTDTNVTLLDALAHKGAGYAILAKYGSLRGLGQATVAELKELLPATQAKRLLLALELGARYSAEPEQRTKVGHPDDVVALLRHLENSEVERFVTLCLGAKNHVLGLVEVSVGTLDSCLAHPRDVFRPAIARNAAAVIVAHNHPSGDPEPSPQDVALTQRLVDAGNLVGISVIDHIIIGRNCHTSLKDRRLLP